MIIIVSYTLNLIGRRKSSPVTKQEDNWTAGAFGMFQVNPSGGQQRMETIRIGGYTVTSSFEFKSRALHFTGNCE
jgi:hypothetical protein